MGERTAVVVGGGIGGLAAGLALHRRGWQIRVLERAPEFTEVGAGISLWPNALRALEALGLGDQIMALGAVDASAGIRDSTGRWLSRTDTKELERRFGQIVMLHRADLLRTLLEALPAEVLSGGAEVTGLRADGTRTVVEHGRGESHADLVIGADGANSLVRRTIWPDAPSPRYSGYTAWRLIAPAPGSGSASGPGPGLGPGLGEAGESVGRGERFGLCPLPDRRVYCYATATVPPGGKAPDSELGELRRRFARWHDPIPALLAAAEPSDVLRHDLYDQPPLRSFVSLSVTGPVALLGDAAHAMTPNLGQGACQALEDAVTLGAVLASHDDVSTALAAYDRQRRSRTQSIVRTSRRIGAFLQAGSAPAAWARDTALRLSPDTATLRAMASILNWTPPAEPALPAG